jgi:hypothetical protein
VAVLGAPVKVAIVVSETTDVCSTLESTGAPPVAVRMMVSGAGTIEVVTFTSFVEVLRSVLVTVLHSWNAGQKPFQNP